MATFNDLYRKYVGSLPSDTKASDDDDGIEEALYPGRPAQEFEEEEYLEMGI